MLAARRKISEDAFIGIWEVTETEQELLALYPANETELEMLRSFTHPFRRTQFLASRLLLHTLVPDGKIVYDENGKPFLREAGATDHRHVSISHTASYIAIMISPYHCGVDLEVMRPKIERIAAKFLSEEELADALHEPAVERLHVYWCVKEALYKVYGQKNVSLRSNIFVSKVEQTSAGQVRAMLTHNGVTLDRQVHYDRFRDCMLAWVN